MVVSLTNARKVAQVFVRARRNAPTVLDPAKEKLHLIPAPIEVRAESDRITPIATGPDVPPGLHDNARTFEFRPRL